MATKFEGWTVNSADSIKGNMKWEEYQVKDFQEDDVELKVLYSGICSSDLHTMSNNWFDVSSFYPLVVGHEIIGEVIKAGPKTEFKEGQIVGVGPMCDSCLECEYCEKGENNFCSKGGVGTYAGKFQRGPSAGQNAQGGYAVHWRGPATFVIPIPEGLDLAATAPLLCAGVTVFNPLEKYGAGTKAKNVGVVGLGGLGHIAVQYAAAMGADVTVISHSAKKNDDAKKMGAKTIIVTGDDPAKACKEHIRSLDLIICTSFDPELPLDAYISLLKPGGMFSLVGASGKPVQLNAFQFIMNGVHFTSSPAHSPAGARRALEFAAKHNIKPWVTKYPIEKANEAVVSMDKGESRYRHVLVVERNGGKL